ncbi:MAG: error-prone DNA polymerase [Sphingobacterium sp.]|jgi:error-prone DNA polymerase|uniref:error-prone DNA polymerase n=1 Tax=Sphingobacterium sp. TaxID=341027 RepID=UPI0028512A00|nr:error-prone DNA polymerase [Sphingobacterium sp.]MDR3010421.1 error-prone DNA polymerase [Sphingobacterium sp.]
MGYCELQITSNFSFLEGASHPEELIERAAQLGYHAVAVTDRNSFAGIVRAHIAAKKEGIRLIPACRLDLQDGPSLLAYPTDKEAYGRLSSLLTVGNLRTEKGKCKLYKADVYSYAEGIIFVVCPPEKLTVEFELDYSFVEFVKECQQHLHGSLNLGIKKLYRGDDAKLLYRINQLGEQLGIPLVVLGDIYYHIPERRELQDILTCIREKCTIHTAGFNLHPNAERYLKSMTEVERLFRTYPEAVQQSVKIANACHFSLDDLKYIYPDELSSNGRTTQEELSYLTWEGARKRFDGHVPDAVRETIQMELDFIERKNYASYFLTVYDYVRFAKERGILCQGRGSAANSTVCYCLGITSVDPSKYRLLFARFMSDARDEPPDIDVDFEHERREEVIQYIYEKYGRNRAAIVATVTQVRSKGAIRDVGKAMGLSMDAVGRLAGVVSSHWDDYINLERLVEQGFNPEDQHLQKVLELTHQYIGFPRQLGQHTGGFVITQGNLHELCPLINARMDNRTNLEWNKDDLEALGFLKVDVLALGMLTCIRKAFDLARVHYGKELTLADIGAKDDPQVYDMICHADTLGVFQIESRAQMSMLPRLKPREFYDLVIEVAIVRPGPIQGDMVHPYLRRRNKEEHVDYPSTEIQTILEKTLGVPLFQEQAMEIAIVAAGFTPAEADELRRSMATFKAKGKVSAFHKKMVDGMVKKHYTEEFANRVFKQLEGFGSYGFPESHAASFALLVYVSSWLKCYYPDIFAASLLNSQPMGFYQPAQIVIDAQKHGVKVLPIDINHSSWDNSLEGEIGKPHALRLGLRQIKGFSQEEALVLTQGRCPSYSSITGMMDAGVSLAALEKLADADAFRSLDIDRRKALWEITALGDRPIALFEGQPSESMAEGQIALPLLTKSQHVVADYARTSLSIKAHPVSFLRGKLDLLQVVPTAKLALLKNDMPVKVCGLITVRQRPGTSKGVLFITIEDDTGFANIVVWSTIFEKYRKEILRSKLFMVAGKIQVEGEVIHVIAQRCFDMSGLLKDLTAADDNIRGVFHKGRNFH